MSDQQTPPETSQEDPFDVVRRRARELAKQLQAGTPPEGTSRRGPFDDLERQDRKQDIGLKKTYATWLKWGLIGQLAIVDVFMIVYAWVGRSWDVPESVIQTWLWATVIQLVGIVLVVTRYLFPRR